MTTANNVSQAEGDLESELAPLAEELEAGEAPAMAEPDFGLPTVAEGIDEASEAALPEDMEMPPELSLDTPMQPETDIDMEAAAHAAAAASIDLTGLADSEIAEMSAVAAEVSEPDDDLDPLLDLGEAAEPAPAYEMPAPAGSEMLLTMGFGAPGIPVPDAFDPTDPSSFSILMEMDETGLLVASELAQADALAPLDANMPAEAMDDELPPPWPFEGDEIPEVQ